MNRLTALYSDMFTSANCTVGEDGLISLTTPTGSTPITIMGDGVERKLYIPYQSVLKSGKWNDIAVVHLANESIFNGQSEILNKLKDLMAMRLYVEVQAAALALALLSKDKDSHGKLNVRQMKMITSFQEFTNGGTSILGRLISASTGITGDNPLLTLTLTRGGTIDGTTYSRTCKLTTPILDTGISKTKGSKAGKAAVTGLYSFVLGVDNPNVGSDSPDHPYLEALVGAYKELASHLNGIRKTLTPKYCGTMKEITLRWTTDFADLQALAKEYMPQTFPFNAGVAEGKRDAEIAGKLPTAALAPTLPKSTAPEAQPLVTAPPQQAVQPPPVVPGTPHQPAVVNSMAEQINASQQPHQSQSQPKPAMSMAEQINANQQGRLMQQQPMYPQQPVQQPMYPQQPVQQPMYPQQPVQPVQQPMYPQQPVQQPMYPQPPYNPNGR